MNEKRSKVWLYSEDVPEGKLFNVTAKQLEELEEQGWKDSPAKLSDGEEAPEGDTPPSADGLNARQLADQADDMNAATFRAAAKKMLAKLLPEDQHETIPNTKDELQSLLWDYADKNGI